jgi:hypothetical protein
MISRAYEMAQEHADRVGAEALSDLEEPDIPEDREASWVGIAGFGILMVISGLYVLPIIGSAGAGIIAVGFFMIIGAFFAKRWEGDDEVFADLDYNWEEEMNARAIEDSLRMRRQERQREIEEIVKVVKSTIRVRCRYCGTLNEEKANKCESCGGSL